MTRNLSHPLTPTNRRDETWHRAKAGRKGKSASPWRYWAGIGKATAAKFAAERAKRRNDP